MISEQFKMTAEEARAFGNSIDANNAYNRQVEKAQSNVAIASGIGAGLGGLGGELYAGGNAAITESHKTAEALYQKELAEAKLREAVRKKY